VTIEELKEIVYRLIGATLIGLSAALVLALFEWIARG
jgi:hypothetical protein